MSNSIYDKKIRPSDYVLKGLIYLAAVFSILLLIAIMGYVFVRGIPQISWQFLTTVHDESGRPERMYTAPTLPPAIRP